MESFWQRKSGRVFKAVSADSFNNKSFEIIGERQRQGKSTFQDVAPPATSSAAIMYVPAC